MKLLSSLLLLVLLAPAAVTAQEAPSAPDQEALIRTLNDTNRQLQEKIRLLETKPSLTSDALARKSETRLRDIAGDVRRQREAMVDFEGFVKWMSGTLSGYEKYIKAGSYAAAFAKALPIPYAGQAATLTKFVSQSVVSLNRTSAAINTYLATSGTFLSMVDAAEKTGSPDAVAAASRFARERLVHDMDEAQLKLRATSDISSSSLSFLQALDHCMGSTDEYWAKAKSVFKKEAEQATERGMISENIRTLKAKAESFDGKLKLFCDISRKDAPLIASLATYEELDRELSTNPPAGQEKMK